MLEIGLNCETYTNAYKKQEVLLCMNELSIITGIQAGMQTLQFYIEVCQVSICNCNKDILSPFALNS